MTSSITNITDTDASHRQTDEPAVETKPVKPAPAAARAEPDFVDRGSPWEQFKKILTPVASLKLTVVLFIFAMALIFAGTLAQVDKGIWAIMKEYFRTWIAWVDSSIFYPDSWNWPSFKFPLPGGYIVGGLMMINLVAAHIVRFRMTWKRSGIIATHAGIILLLIGELITALAAKEGQIQIEQQSASNFAVDIERAELVLIKPQVEGGDQVISIPEEMLHTGAVLNDPKLPMSIKVLAYYPNTQIIQRWPSNEIAGPPSQMSRGGVAWQALGQLMTKHQGDTDPAVQAAVQQARSLIQMQQAAQQASANNRWPTPIDPANLNRMITFFNTAKVNRFIARMNKNLAPFQFGDTKVGITPLAINDGTRTYTYVPDRDSDEWKAQGKNWLIWNAWGGDAGMLWIEDLQSAEPNLAPDSMIGSPYLIKSLAVGSGVDVDMTADVASAYVEITNPNPLNADDAVTRHLLTSHMGGAHAISRMKPTLKPGDKLGTSATADMWLTSIRFEREYKPYTVRLLEFRHDKYTGSDKARNFSSKINIYGPDGKLQTERPIIISMNQPLRFKGETFFQSSFLREGSNDAAGTVLQVVRNPGWLLPYIACIVVSIGLLVHFGYMLDRYIRRMIKTYRDSNQQSSA